MTETGLLERYKVLLREYNRILSISQMILEKLKIQEEDKRIIQLLERKQILAENITKLAQEITLIKITDQNDPNLRNLPKVKAILYQIAEKTKQIQKIEEKIQSFL